MALRTLSDAFLSIRCQILQSSYHLTSLEPSTLGVLHHGQSVRHMGTHRQNQPRRRWITPEINKVELGGQKLTDENVEFLKDMVKQTYVSPLKEPPAQRVPWAWHTQRCGLICRKLGTLPQWTKTGKKILTTLVQVVDNHVISQSPSVQFAQTWRGEHYKAFKRRYGTVVVGAESIDPTNLTDDYMKLFEPSGMQPKRRLSKFIVSDHALIDPGTPLHATHFRVGDYVDVGGRTVDHGFQGVMKRWGFRGGPASHGSTKFHRKGGSIGFSRHAGRVWKGKKMPGHMGNRYRIQRGLQILRMNTRYDVLYIRGRSIPGSVNSWCLVMDTKIPTKRAVKNPPPMPTHYPDDDQNPLAEDILHSDLHNYEDPTIVFQMTEDDMKQKRTGAKTALKGGKPAATKASPAAAKAPPAAKATKPK